MNDYLCGSIWAKCFSRKFIEDNKIRFTNNLRKAQDRMFMLECINKCDKIYYLPLLSYKYFSNDDSICHKINFKMIDYYYNLFVEVNKFLNENKIDKSLSKFFVYSVFNELLLLTVFHPEYKKNYLKKRKDYYEIYNQFLIKNSVRNLRVSDFISFKAKIRFISIKFNLFFVLLNLSLLKNKHDNKNNFEKYNI